jgi:hypothetical protein
MTLSRDLQEAARRGCGVSYRYAGRGPAIGLLHAIGVERRIVSLRADGVVAQFRVIASDAAGYRASAPLPVEHPDAGDYAAALDAWPGPQPRALPYRRTLGRRVGRGSVCRPAAITADNLDRDRTPH